MTKKIDLVSGSISQLVKDYMQARAESDRAFEEMRQRHDLLAAACGENSRFLCRVDGGLMLVRSEKNFNFISVSLEKVKEVDCGN